MSIIKYMAYLKTVETGSITRAAAQLGYTQSAISRMIADLESEWNMKLLTRNRTGIEISSEGITLLPAIQSICKEYEDLEFAVSEIHGLNSGTLRLGAFTSMATGWLPLMLLDFHQEHPHINFQVVNGEYNQIATWLRRGAIDCGFLALPTTNGLRAEFLLRDPLVVVLPTDHPLADAPCFPIAQLSQEENFIDLKEEQDYEISRFLDHLKQKPRIKYEVSNDFVILAMVECGLGISVVHELILHPNRYGIVKKPFDTPQYRDIGIAVNRDSPPSSITQIFVDHAVRWARDLSAAMELNTSVPQQRPDLPPAPSL